MDNSGKLLAAEIHNLLQDEPMFDFLCERTFSNHSDQGIVTLRDIAPVVQSILQSAGQSVSSNSIYEVWQKYCDPDMHQMALPHFTRFLRALLQQYLCDEHKLRELETRATVTQMGAGKTWSSIAEPKEASAQNLWADKSQARQPEPVPKAALPSSRARSQSAGRSLGRPHSAEARAEVRAEARRSARTEELSVGSLGRRATPKAKHSITASRPGPAAPPPSEGDRKEQRSMAVESAARETSKPSRLPEPPEDALTKAFREIPEAGDLALLRLERGDAAAGLCVKTGPGIFTSMRDALQAMQRLKQELRDSFFVDRYFGPEAQDSPDVEHFRDVAWLRPGEAWERHSFCGELAEVRLGTVEDAWFLGALCSMSLTEPLLFGHPSGRSEPLGVYPRLFWDPELRRRGLYCFRFSKHGRWFYVLIDDRLPFRRREPLFSRTHGLDRCPQIWLALMEKAYAKLHGSYLALSLGFVDDALEDLTSWPVEKIQISKFAGKLLPEGSPLPAERDLDELWQTLSKEIESGAALVCLRSDSGSTGASSDTVQVDPRLLNLETQDDGGLFSTGVLSNWAYPLLAVREVEAEAGVLQFARLRSFTSSRWCGPWSDEDLAWSQAGKVSEQLRVEGWAEFLPACGLRAEGSGVHQQILRPQMLLQELEKATELHDGTFVMRFLDWLQVFSHVLLQQPLLDECWQTRHLQGAWTQDTCGGTPIPVMQPVLATLESWGRNPQCRLTLLHGANVELCVTLHQQDARLLSEPPFSTFPFEEKLRQIFLCVMMLASPDEHLRVFDKKRIVRSNKASAVSLLSRRRSVSLRTRLPGPGSYAIVPSIWEPELEDEAPRPHVAALPSLSDIAPTTPRHRDIAMQFLFGLNKGKHHVKLQEELHWKVQARAYSSSYVKLCLVRVMI